MPNLIYKNFWGWLDYFVILIISVSIISIGLLITDVFGPKQALILGATLGTLVFYILRKRSISIVDGGSIGLLPLLALLLFAAIFRLDPYPWINGGQDQGVYVSMAAHYQRGGSIFIEDPLPTQLDTPDLNELYKANLPKGGFQPGVYYGGEKDYVFQFYHLHPLWMAIFAELFGDGAHAYSLTFFSLISIAFLSLLAFELSNSRTAALSVGLLLAVNPLHVFFSKWPATEVVALAFSSMSFYYLARAYRSAMQGGGYRITLVISCLALTMLFFVRISGFLYLPVLLLVFMAGIWLRKVRGQVFGTDLVWFALSCIGLYVISVLYGLKYSPNYSNDIYSMTFGKLAGIPWPLGMSALLVGMFLAMYAWHRLLSKEALVAKIMPYIQPRNLIAATLLIAFCALMLSLYKVYQLGFTDAYADHPWLGKRWNLSALGMSAVERSSVLNWLAYSSPLLVLVGVVALLRRKVDFRLALLLLVPMVSLSVFAVSNPALPYQYYYARYLLTEAVPYAIVIFTVAIVGSGTGLWRKLGIAVTLASVLWFGFFTVKQFGVEEGVRPLHVLQRIVSHVDEGDVLLIEPAGWSIPRFGVETPLRFYFGLNTFALGESERGMHARKIAHSFRNVWLLSPKPINDERFFLQERLLHRDKVMERVGQIALKVDADYWHQELYLYVMKKTGWPSSQGAPFRFDRGRYPVGSSAQEVALIMGDGWHALEQAHVWSSAQAQLVLDSKKFPDGVLPRAMVLEAAPFGASQTRPVRVRVTGCGNDQEHDYASSERVELRIPLPTPGTLEQCTIELHIDNATTPQALGYSSDSRVLGLALYAFSFE